jgi:SAM-dependent methyltransferase
MSDSGRLHDPQTLAFYDRAAAQYGARRLPQEHPRLTAFLNRLAPGAHVLDLGCGGGQDAAAMLAKGFEVTAVDGSPGLAAVAAQRIGRPVQVLLFEDLAFAEAFDGIWANASLTHAPLDGLSDILGRVRRALRPGGLFYAGYKAGDGGGRDALGRWFSYLTEAELRGAYDAAGPWSGLELEHRQGGAYDRRDQAWLHVTAARPA